MGHGWPKKREKMQGIQGRTASLDPHDHMDAGMQGMRGNSFLILYLPCAYGGHMLCWVEGKPHIWWPFEHGASTEHQVGHLKGDVCDADQ